MKRLLDTKGAINEGISMMMEQDENVFIMK